MPRVIRKLVWFRKDNDELVGRADLRGIPLRDLRTLFNSPPDDPNLYLCYEVGAVQKEAIQCHVEHRIRLDRYAYFVEAEAARSGARVSASRRSVA